MKLKQNSTTKSYAEAVGATLPRTSENFQQPTNKSTIPRKNTPSKDGMNPTGINLKVIHRLCSSTH